MPTAIDDLTRARQAFDLWRAKRQCRTRIPHHLWQKALSLLDNHPITRVARQLRLDPAELKKRRLAAAQTLAPTTAPAPQFMEVPAPHFISGIGSTRIPEMGSPHRPTDTALRLQIERADGYRLTLSVPSSEWPRIEALYSLFLRA